MVARRGGGGPVLLRFGLYLARFYGNGLVVLVKDSRHCGHFCHRIYEYCSRGRQQASKVYWKVIYRKAEYRTSIASRVRASGADVRTRQELTSAAHLTVSCAVLHALALSSMRPSNTKDECPTISPSKCKPVCPTPMATYLPILRPGFESQPFSGLGRVDPLERDPLMQRDPGGRGNCRA